MEKHDLRGIIREGCCVDGRRYFAEKYKVMAIIVPVGVSDAGEQKDVAELSREATAEAASQYLIYELSKLNERRKGVPSVDKENRIKVGIAGGSTIFRLAFALDQSEFNIPVELFPLVLGPMPDSIWSAGAIADLIRLKLGPAVHISRLAQYSLAHHERGIQLTKNEAVQHYLDTSLNGERKTGEPFDMIITSIGALHEGSTLYNVLQQLGYDDEQIGRMMKDGCVGDVCSIPITRTGHQYCDRNIDKNSRLLGMNGKMLKDFAETAACKTIGIVSGVEKAKAVLAAMRGGYLNILITDETTAEEIYFLSVTGK